MLRAPVELLTSDTIRLPMLQNFADRLEVGGGEGWPPRFRRRLEMGAIAFRGYRY
jgi:hypothetical protein